MNKRQEYYKQAVFKKRTPEESFVNEKLLNVNYSNEEKLTWLLESLNVFFICWWTEGWRWKTPSCYKLPDCWIP